VKPQGFAALAVATAAMLVLAIASYASQTRLAQVKTSGAPLFPDLAAAATRIAKVELRQGDKTLTLVRGNDGWSLADHGDYPVKPEAVRNLLMHLARAELIEAKTRNKDRHALLELEDPAGKDAKSRLVRVSDAAGTTLAGAIIGKKRYDAFGASKGGSYVRRVDDEQTWLASVEIDVPLAPRDWVQATLYDVPAAKITAVSVELPGEEALKITRDAADASKHALPVPAGKKLKDAGAADAVVRAVASVDLDDVRKASPAAGSEVGVVKIEADGGLTLTLRLRKQGEDHWVTVEAAGSGEEGKKTAEAIAKRTQGFEFKIAPSKAQSILKGPGAFFEAA
jgi:hypothetical protein